MQLQTRVGLTAVLVAGQPLRRRVGASWSRRLNGSHRIEPYQVVRACEHMHAHLIALASGLRWPGLHNTNACPTLHVVYSRMCGRVRFARRTNRGTRTRARTRPTGVVDLDGRVRRPVPHPIIRPQQAWARRVARRDAPTRFRSSPGEWRCHRKRNEATGGWILQHVGVVETLAARAGCLVPWKEPGACGKT